MPSLGGFLKKKKTKDSDQPGLDNDNTLKTLPTNSSTTTTSDNLYQSTSNQSQTSAVAAQSAVTSAPQDAPTINQNSGQQYQQQQQSQQANRSSATGNQQTSEVPQTDGSGNQTSAAMMSSHHQSGQHQHRPATQMRQTKGKYTLTDFSFQRTLGTGSFGRVHLVQSKHNQRFYAVKVLKKAQVVKMKQIEHTNDERRMLQQVKHAFLITLWGTFQDAKNVYMVMDFVEGGELFSLLRKSQVG